MSKDVLLDSIADDLAVRYAYLYLLGRPPESESVVREVVDAHRRIRDVREAMLNCREFALSAASRFWRGTLSGLTTASLDRHDSNSRIIFLQTADSRRYAKMLEVCSVYNGRYCDKWNITFTTFTGIKHGVYPHHATLNRVHLLHELAWQGYRGWVFYADADCVVANPDWDIRETLSVLRERGQFMLAHPVYAADHELHEWWNINAGAFAIDLAHNHARAIVACWRAFYTEMYSLADYEAAREWNDIINDQASLQYLLEVANSYGAVREKIELQSFQLRHLRQALRLDGENISSEEEISRRIELLKSIGRESWGF